MLNTIHFCEYGITLLQCLMKIIYYEPANKRGDVEIISFESTESIVRDLDTILTLSLIKRGPYILFSQNGPVYAVELIYLLILFSFNLKTISIEQ